MYPPPDRRSTVVTDDPGSTLIDLAGRIMLTHSIALDHAMSALRIDRDDAVAVIDTGHLARPLDAAGHDRLRLFVNILLRLERRLDHDSAAMRRALEGPLDALGGVSPAQMLGGSLEDLRAVRQAIDTVEAPKVKWWRVGH